MYRYIYIPSGRLVCRRLTCIFLCLGGGGVVLGEGGLGGWGAITSQRARFSGFKCYNSALFSGCNCYVIALFSGCKCYVIALFQGVNARLSLCFQGVNATLSLCVQGVNATLSLCVQGVNATLSLCFRGVNATLSLCVQGVNATLSLFAQGVIATFTLKTVLTALQLYRDACSKGIVRTSPAECYDENKVPWLPWRKVPFPPTAKQAAWAYIHIYIYISEYITPFASGPSLQLMSRPVKICLVKGQASTVEVIDLPLSAERV